MKIYFTILCLVVSLFTNAQVIKNTYIDTVGIMNIYGNGKVIIGKAIIQQTLQTKLFLLKSDQQKDSTGIYTTILCFGNKEKVPLFGVDLLLKFSDSIISVNGSRSGDDISAADGTMTYGYLSENYKELTFKAVQVNQQPFTDCMINFIIKSSKKITFTIRGIQGILN